MNQLTGQEFQNEKGTQGSLFKWIWSKIYTYFNQIIANFEAAIAPLTGRVTTLEGGLAAELVARANGDTVLQNGLNTLQAAIAGLKTITPWDATAAFPTVRTDGQPFEKGNYVQVIVPSGPYKAGDVLICTADGATTVAGFGDVDSNVDIATDAVFGTVKLVASLAEYNGTDPATGSKVITKSVLQAILGEVTAAITVLYQNADSVLQATITTAYTNAISTALANYYTKAETDALLAPITTNVSSLQTAVAALTAAMATKADKTAVITGLNALKSAFIAALKSIERRKTNTISSFLSDFPSSSDISSQGNPDDFSIKFSRFYIEDLPVIHDIKNLRVGGLSLSVKTIDVPNAIFYESFSELPVSLCADKDNYDVVVVRYTEVDGDYKICYFCLFFNTAVFTDITILSDNSLWLISEVCPYECEADIEWDINQSIGTIFSSGLNGLA